MGTQYTKTKASSIIKVLKLENRRKNNGIHRKRNNRRR